jgi:hypothetical protein
VDLNLPGSGRTVAQTFSVFDYDTGKYRYFAAPIAALPLTGHYRAPRNRTPEGLAAPLPPQAKQVGEGDVPRGVVAAAPGISGLGETPPMDVKKALVPLLLLAGAFVVWKGMKR